MKPDGYNLTFGSSESKCTSLTTGSRTDGRFDFYVHLFGGPGGERHLHGFGEVSSKGILITGGARLKEGPGDHLGGGIMLGHTTQELARIRVQATPTGPETQLLQCTEEGWIATSRSTWSSKITRRPVMLPGSKGAIEADYSLALFDARTGTIAPSSETIVLPFSGGSHIGVCISLVDRSE